MEVIEKEIIIPKVKSNYGILQHAVGVIKQNLGANEMPIRFVISSTGYDGYHCELDVLKGINTSHGSIFDFKKRAYESTDKFNAVLLIPTGIGAELGGHCGDGNAVARLIASACDTLITHPNVVNASDINEMTENTLYVEGSTITRLMMGQIGLQKVRSNKVLMIMDKHAEPYFNREVINAVSSARVTLGLDCDVYEMDSIIESNSLYSKSGRAAGEIKYIERLFDIIDKHKHKYDAIGLSTLVNMPDEYHKIYFEDGSMINPWGGIEAMLTHSISQIFNIPCAHSPMIPSLEVEDIDVGIVDPRKAPESASITYLHCILKGLHRSPQIVSADKGLSVEDVSCLIIPDKCIGLPTLAALEHGIPVIAVRENKNCMNNKLEELPFDASKLFIVDSYLEAVGVMQALKAGVTIESVRRPIDYTFVHDNKYSEALVEKPEEKVS